MSARDLIYQALADGVQITATPAGKVRYLGPEDAVGRWLPAIRQNKVSILEALATRTSVSVLARHWFLHFRDRQPVEVFRSPPATHAEVLADNLEAVAAEPVPMLDTDQGEGDPVGDDPGAECRYCVTCWHRRRPGLSAGYCGGERLDLAPAYGPGHSLRELPADGGENCNEWKERDHANP